jgi:hypothetical protein
MLLFAGHTRRGRDRYERPFPSRGPRPKEQPHPPSSAPRHIAALLLLLPQVGLLVVTRGAAGAFAVRGADGARWAQPTRQRDVVDTTGSRRRARAAAGLVHARRRLRAAVVCGG